MILTLRVFAPFAFGYFLSYVYRVVNATIAGDLVGELSLTAADLGLLTSTYFLTFAAFQVPLGMLLDRFGPRRTESVLLVFAAAGAFVFAIAPSVPALMVGRALIGFGVSACLMGAFKAFVQWFPGERLPLVNGLQMAVGAVGAMTATAPVEFAMGFTDWRGVFMGLGVLTLACAAILFMVVPDHAGEAPKTTLRAQFGGVLDVMTSPLFWRVAPLTFTAQASFLATQSLWAGPWLRDVGGLDGDAVAQGLLVAGGTMGIGFVMAGLIAERAAKFGIRPMGIAFFFIALSMAVQTLIVFEAPIPAAALWAAYALLGTSGIVVYAGLSQVFPRHLAGRVNTSMNLLVFVGSFAFQWGTGIIIDLWPLTASGGYDPAAYRAGFGLVLATQVVSMLWLVLYRRAPLPLKF